MAHNTIGKIIYETCNAIWEVFSSIHCIGCIDSKHIRIKCPNNSGSMFYNYKGYFSVHLQGVCDAKYKFISVDNIGAYGRQSDSGIFTESNIFKNLEAKSFNVPNYRQGRIKNLLGPGVEISYGPF
ncbi:unnamed protein product [Macrosiphum euphorbiae]|uniref:DDE Tnp4 domain-containing protein n=1 Tax=Macrosiphum euphorbiae TaxID=13131 RepID=A0AAV0WT19_9HEMI|nr:unnamed protein product [Macrosiphum euphorbiae]